MKNIVKPKKILLSGGGTGGSVMPLLAAAADLKKGAPGVYDFLFVGTTSGPEKFLVEKAGLKFKTIISGKWRRYFSLKNCVDVFKIFLGFWQSFFILLNYRPDLIISAGSFASVPLVWSAGILRIPVLIHQQDIRPGLANKLMAPFAKIITVTFAKSLADYGSKAVLIGNPLQGYADLTANFKAEEIDKKFGLQADYPLVLVIGGGTGSLFINNLVDASRLELTKFCQIVHLSGRHVQNQVASGQAPSQTQISSQTQILNQVPASLYKQFSFLPHTEVLELMQRATLVVSRCGLGVLTELAALQKPALLIPMPHSHQEDNAQVFTATDAAIVKEEKYLTPEIFVSTLQELLQNKTRLSEIASHVSQVIKIGNEEFIKIIQSLLF